MSDGGDLVELAKRRGFFLQSAGAYGGVSGFYTFGPSGAALKQNIEDTWRNRFAIQEGNMEVDAPTVMPEPVFEASGHLDGFDDMLVECPECGESHRADHIVEDNTDIEEAESIPVAEVEELIAEYELVCPTCGTGLAGQAIEDFNLMFETNIGPGSADPGYLRPETAQGIFIEFPQLAEYARNQLPFGVTQIGRAYRNEISPRKSLLRVREFTQAELELFVDPEEDEPALEAVADVTAPFYPAADQEAADGQPYEATIREVVDDGVVGKPWIAYYLGVAKQWYESIGVDMDRFRFRQHLSGERAHYAADCWDAEAEVDGDWIELGGFAYRSDYDLSKHDSYSDEEFTVFKQYDEPVTVERATVDPDMSYLGPEFGGSAGAVADALEALAERDPDAFDESEVVVEVDGESHAVPVEKTNFGVEEVIESGEHITPHVVEPSLGIDRALYTALDHSYREDEVDGEERTYLALPQEVAPTTVGVFPLMDRDGMGEYARDLVEKLRAAGLAVTYDDSGAIGRRYRRQDEVGTPFCVTVDYATLGEARDDEGEPAAPDTVTVRERDTTAQKRVPVADLPETLTALRDGERTFDDL
ncbi:MULTISPECIES: glycine--tRNA ligase [Halomicrobium]|uniref:glycine--tRNA ligase n=2 Tax=Halomicrobium mukohataei TaxID=57705 RepID=C7P019_HALMD|nr:MULTISPECIES: glycine--tRNA ligase [Halomicrobium]ACV46927.1 glycyl-tRNA synthetase [Halomicrobium mukohataei DSM 12286]QCD65423.1 glycine--tRNA ligase [Halomicrobium mukohataei]QFR20229.1 glycine--tRNA ligase [Halomicrobium sp. ZPS1]